MIALILVLAGWALIVGAKGISDKLVRVAAGLVLIITFGMGLLGRLELALRSARQFEGPRPETRWVAPTVLMVGVLATIGFVAWKLRPIIARRRDAIRKQHSSPRDRALPPPPDASGGEP